MSETVGTDTPLDVANATCFHCMAPLADAGLEVNVDGETKRVCSDTCRQTVVRILDLNLDAYYDYRRRFMADSSGDFGDTGSAPESGDRKLAFASSLAPHGSGYRLSVRIPDMRCAACSWLIENSLRQRDDVGRCRTNLADKLLTVEFEDTDPMALIEYVEGLGYTVLPDRSTTVKQSLHAERKSMLARLGVAGIGMMQVMMFALATYVAGSGGIEPAYESLMRWASMVVATPIVFYSAIPFHRGALRDLRLGSLGMDVPVSLAIGAAYVLSVFNTITHGNDVYFDSVCMFTFLLLIGRFVELGSRQRYQQSQMLNDSLLPVSALLAGSGVRVPVERVNIDDVVAVRPGEAVPVDGIVVDGTSSVSEAAFTGEGKPVTKAAGARVLAGSDNLDGELDVRTTTTYDNFVITKIARLYRESSSYKPRFSQVADRVARYFVAAILLIAAASGAWWYLVDSTQWFSVALAVLVVSCPCALSLATPVAYTVALSAMRNKGIVIGNGTFLERLAGVTRIVFDKTGTLTRGSLRIDRIEALAIPARQAQELAAALEEHSRHPIARAFSCGTRLRAESVEVFPGEGVMGWIDGRRYRIGKPSFACDYPPTPPVGDAMSEEGTWILLADDTPLAWFCLGDDVREEARDVIGELQRGLPVAMLTGDVESEAARLAGRLGITDFRAGMTPVDKLDYLRHGQQDGDRVLMVGDGINDAAAMGVAEASIAVSPVDVMVQEAADATLLHADLRRIPLALEFSRKVGRVIRQNIAWAIGYNLCVIPLAVSGTILPWMAALGMSASSAFVVLNANRLRKV